jgi:hypothetical protein
MFRSFRSQALGDPAKRVSIIVNVLEDVEADDRVEQATRKLWRQMLDAFAAHVNVRDIPRAVCECRRQGVVRLERDDALDSGVRCQLQRERADTRPNLEHGFA